MISLLKNTYKTRLSPPKLSLFGLILVSTILTSISMAVFWKSETKNTVQTIQANSQSSVPIDAPAPSINNDGQLSVAELLLIIQSIEGIDDSLSPDQDLASDEIDPANLGF